MSMSMSMSLSMSMSSSMSMSNSSSSTMRSSGNNIPKIMGRSKSRSERMRGLAVIRGLSGLAS
eukprot:12122154-Heterocapsa_arctica.AAC.1